MNSLNTHCLFSGPWNTTIRCSKSWARNSTLRASNYYIPRAHWTNNEWWVMLYMLFIIYLMECSKDRIIGVGAGQVYTSYAQDTYCESSGNWIIEISSKWNIIWKPYKSPLHSHIPRPRYSFCHPTLLPFIYSSNVLCGTYHSQATFNEWRNWTSSDEIKHQVI
jgi:hypothetical protein